MGLLRLPGAAAVLAAHGAALPQPDQLCGPFSAWVALHALLPEPPSLTDLAAASRTTVWPHDVTAWRPAGAPLDRTGWSSLPRAGAQDESGTDAAALASGVATLAGVAVVAASGGDVGALLRGLVAQDRPVGVLANVRTGPLGLAWDVGHFVVVHTVGAIGEDSVGIADTYRELGAPDQPPGCREISLHALVAGLTAAPGRGLLLLLHPDDEADTRRLVTACGASDTLWST